MTKDHNTEQAVKVRHAFENIRNNYEGWQDNPNFKVLEDALAALSQVRGKQEPVAWSYCPECGCEEWSSSLYARGQICDNCGQEWFPHVDYTDVIIKHIGEWHSDRAAAPQVAQEEGAREGRIRFELTYEQVQALYLTLFRRERPAYGWMEAPLQAIEESLKPAHMAIHDRSFNSMNRQFFGDDRFAMNEAPMPQAAIAAPQSDAQQSSEKGEQA